MKVGYYRNDRCYHKSKKQNIIPSIKPYLQKLKNTDFRLSSILEELALRESGEI
ncbi:MAG: DUF3368 domain-containing protein [Ignavibacteria bacterium]|nr:DUF3368 domain-containing protein [Ignavibacteria bacterium]